MLIIRRFKFTCLKILSILEGNIIIIEFQILNNNSLLFRIIKILNLRRLNGIYLNRNYFIVLILLTPFLKKFVYILSNQIIKPNQIDNNQKAKHINTYPALINPAIFIRIIWIINHRVENRKTYRKT